MHLKTEVSQDKHYLESYLETEVSQGGGIVKRRHYKTDVTHSDI